MPLLIFLAEEFDQYQLKYGEDYVFVNLNGDTEPTMSTWYTTCMTDRCSTPTKISSEPVRWKFRPSNYFWWTYQSSESRDLCGTPRYSTRQAWNLHWRMVACVWSGRSWFALCFQRLLGEVPQESFQGSSIVLRVWGRSGLWGRNGSLDDPHHWLTRLCSKTDHRLLIWPIWQLWDLPSMRSHLLWCTTGPAKPFSSPARYCWIPRQNVPPAPWRDTEAITRDAIFQDLHLPENFSRKNFIEIAYFSTIRKLSRVRLFERNKEYQKLVFSLKRVFFYQFNISLIGLNSSHLFQTAIF